MPSAGVECFIWSGLATAPTLLPALTIPATMLALTARMR
jgi:hypothetical protein